jgi:hypothetical protein
MDDSQAFVL